MGQYGQIIENTIQQALAEVFNIIDEKGVDSEHVGHTKCLRVEEEEFNFNLEGGRYLTEITREELIDNSGYHYNFFVLDTEDLINLLDHLIEENEIGNLDKAKYEVTNIEYDTDGEEIDLPKKLEIEVSNKLKESEIDDFISDEISNITGFCHKGFSTNKI